MATAASIQAVQEAYIAYYGRPGDPAGIDFWAERLDAAGGNTSAMISAFGTSAEASARYASLSVTDAVNAIYNQVLGRDAEAGATGIDFYVNKVLSGEFSLVTLAQNIWDGATSGTDAQTVANKLTAANSFTQTLRDDAAANTAYAGDNAGGNARNWLAEVGSTEASVTSQTAAIATTIATISAAPTNPGSTFTLTTGIGTSADNFSGTAKDDTFDGSRLASLQTTDVLSDASSSDNDVLNATLNSTDQAPKVSNVETINVTGQYLTTGLDLTNITGGSELNFNTLLVNGRGTVAGVNSLATTTINAGGNLEGISITSLSTGTRDSIQVNLGQASGTVTGGAGVDLYSVSVGSGGSVGFETFATGTGDDVQVANKDTSSFKLLGSGSISKLTINASGALTLNAFSGLASGTVVNSESAVTIDFSGSTSLLNDAIVTKSGAGVLTVVAGQMNLVDGASSTDLSRVAADYIRIDDGPASAASTLRVNADSIITLATALGATITFDAGSGGVTDFTNALIIELDASQGAGITIGDNTNVLNITSSTGTVVAISAGLTLGADLNVINLFGDNPIALGGTTNLVGSANATSFVVSAANLNAALTMTGTNTMTVYGGPGSDLITVLGTASAVYGGAGSDTLVADKTAASLLGEGGDDILSTSVATATMTGGDGADTFRIVDTVQQTISDFTKGVDKIQLYSSVTGNSGLDLSNVTVSSGVYTFANNASVKLTGNTASDLRDSVQFGRNADNPLVLTGKTAAVVGGVFNDYVNIVGGASAAVNTLTLGTGQDTILLNVSDSTANGTSIVNDFVVGTDVIVLHGTYSATTVINPHAATLSNGTYTFGTSKMTLKSGATDLTALDLSTSVQFGWSGGATNKFSMTSSSDIHLGSFNDFVSAAADSTIFVHNGGGVDTIYGTATLKVSYDNMTGITTAESDIASGATSLTDVETGYSYVFADSESAVAGTRLEFAGSMSAGAASLVDVATFLNGNLTMASGERFVAVINDKSAASAYAYYVDVDGAVTEEDITLITIFDINVTAATNIND